MHAIPFIIIALLTVALAVISVGESYGLAATIYTSPCMVTLWALAAVASAVVMIRRRIQRRPSLMLMHMAFVVILVGAAVTHCCGVSGTIHLRLGDTPTDLYVGDAGGTECRMPVSLALVDFEVVHYPGTSAPRDFVSRIAVTGGDTVTLSMNSPARAGGYRLLQGSYDSDGLGVTLGVSHDPWGTGITYAGYALLGISFILYFFSRNTTWRRAAGILRAGAPVLLALLAAQSAWAEGQRLDSEALDRLGLVAVYHNDRVSPMATVARDFAVSVTDSERCGGYSAEQLLAGYLFDFGSFKSNPLILIKNKELRALLGIEGRRVSYTDFFAATVDGRLDIDDPAVQQRYGADIQRFETVNMLVSGALLRVFPVADADGHIAWYAPTDRLPADMDDDRWLFVRKFWGLYNEQMMRRDTAAMSGLLDALDRYQRTATDDAMPSPSRLRLERTYNGMSRMLPVAIVAIVAGMALFVMLAIRPRAGRVRRVTGLAACALLWVWLTVLTAIRWMVSGHVPMSNGYETMVFMAWCIALIGCAAHRSALMTAMALLSAGLALAVAAMSGAGSGISGLMPVLASPLLSIHVACVMASYSLFILMVLTGVMALCRRGVSIIRLTALSRVMLYPALMLLTAGIFIGAVWAEVSWGRYWGWDPKEVWALITMLVYTMVAHPTLLPRIARPRTYHIYCIAAFVSVLITYFGVNYILGGLHSYA